MIKANRRTDTSCSVKRRVLKELLIVASAPGLNLKVSFFNPADSQFEMKFSEREVLVKLNEKRGTATLEFAGREKDKK